MERQTPTSRSYFSFMFLFSANHPRQQRQYGTGVWVFTLQSNMLSSVWGNSSWPCAAMTKAYLPKERILSESRATNQTGRDVECGSFKYFVSDGGSIQL